MPRFRIEATTTSALRCAARWGDETHRSHYTLDLREILVYGDIAVVRLIWTLDESKKGSSVTVRSLEPGMDIFQRQKDGSWKIIRYLAYTSPE